MNKVSEKKIHITDDYSIFQTLEGNRSIKDDRVAKIIKSITDVGYVTNPVIVNENMEIIDGQGRVRAFEELGIPVEYVFHEGAGIDECRSLNINQKNWTLKDYIESYAATGRKIYKWLLDMSKHYKGISIDCISALAYSKGRAMNTGSSGGAEEVKRGNLDLTQKEMRDVEWILSYLNNFSEMATKIGGRKFVFYSALIFCYHCESCDENRVYDLLQTRYREIPPCHTVSMYLSYIEKIYNANQRKNKHIYLEHEYEVSH